MKYALITLSIAIIMTFAGCSSMNRDAEASTFITEIDSVTAEIVRAIDEKPTTGIDRAQQILSERKSKLKASYDKLKDLKGYELSKTTTDKVVESVAKNVESISNLQIKYAEESVENRKFGEKLTKLSADFNSIFGV